MHKLIWKPLDQETVNRNAAFWMTDKERREAMETAISTKSYPVWPSSDEATMCPRFKKKEPQRVIVARIYNLMMRCEYTIEEAIENTRWKIWDNSMGDFFKEYLKLDIYHSIQIIEACKVWKKEKQNA